MEKDYTIVNMDEITSFLRKPATGPIESFLVFQPPVIMNKETCEEYVYMILHKLRNPSGLIFNFRAGEKVEKKLMSMSSLESLWYEGFDYASHPSHSVKCNAERTNLSLETVYEIAMSNNRPDLIFRIGLSNIKAVPYMLKAHCEYAERVPCNDIAALETMLDRYKNSSINWSCVDGGWGKFMEHDVFTMWLVWFYLNRGNLQDPVKTFAVQFGNRETPLSDIFDELVSRLKPSEIRLIMGDDVFEIAEYISPKILPEVFAGIPHVMRHKEFHRIFKEGELEAVFFCVDRLIAEESTNKNLMNTLISDLYSPEALPVLLRYGANPNLLRLSNSYNPVKELSKLGYEPTFNLILNNITRNNLEYLGEIFDSYKGEVDTMRLFDKLFTVITVSESQNFLDCLLMKEPASSYETAFRVDRFRNSTVYSLRNLVPSISIADRVELKSRHIYTDLFLSVFGY